MLNDDWKYDKPRKEYYFNDNDLAEHDSDLLDKVAERINSLKYDTCDDVARRIEHQLKAEVFKVINDIKAEVS